MDAKPDQQQEEPAEDPQAELEAAQAKAEEHREQYLRAAAETENARKRAQRDIEHARRFALERFVTDLIPVRDSIEMGLSAAGDDAAAEAVRTGLEITLRQFDQVLAAHGVETIDPAGAPFDPERHEAMSVVRDADAEPGSVVAVVQKGFLLHGRLVRPARVLVAADPEESVPGA